MIIERKFFRISYVAEIPDPVKADIERRKVFENVFSLLNIVEVKKSSLCGQTSAAEMFGTGKVAAPDVHDMQSS